MSLRRANEAYLYMLELIEEGVEYPDAQWKASSLFDVSHEDLQTMYDGESFDHGLQRTTDRRRELLQRERSLQRAVAAQPDYGRPHPARRS